MMFYRANCGEKFNDGAALRFNRNLFSFLVLTNSNGVKFNDLSEIGVVHRQNNLLIKY